MISKWWRPEAHNGLTAGALLTVVAALALMPNPAAAEYRLAVGDVLEISAVGIPELKHRAQVNVDGEISLPLGGQIHVNGLGLSEVQAKVRELLPTREFRRRNEAGREYPVILAPGEIDVIVAEYRPVYLNGDVAKPGEQPYRPGLTVRQAIALAGGYDVLRYRINNPFIEQAELRSEYTSLWTEFAKEQTRIARLQAELDGKDELDRRSMLKAPIATTLTSAIENLEFEQLQTRNADYAKEKVYLTEAAAKEGGRLTILAEQNQKELAGAQADAEDLERLQGLFQRGAVPITRVVDSRRSLLLASTRQLQTASELAQVERQQQEFNRKSVRLDDLRRLEILRDLQDTNVRLATIRSRLQAASEKLVYVGMVRSQLVRGQGSKPELAVHRKTGKTRDRLMLDEDAELLPGDVVEVSLQGDLVPGLPAQ